MLQLVNLVFIVLNTASSSSQKTAQFLVFRILGNAFSLPFNTSNFPRFSPAILATIPFTMAPKANRPEHYTALGIGLTGLFQARNPPQTTDASTRTHICAPQLAAAARDRVYNRFRAMHGGEGRPEYRLRACPAAARGPTS